MTPLTEQQREALIAALVECWKDRLADGCFSLDEVVDDWLYNGRTGYVDYSDAELVETMQMWSLEEQLDELDIEYEEED